MELDFDPEGICNCPRPILDVLRRSSQKSPIITRPKLRLPISRKPSIVERNGARFWPWGNMQMPKTHFGRFETFVTKIPYYHSPETSIADVSKTVDRRVKRSSISTQRAYTSVQGPFWTFWDVLKNPRWPPGSKLRLPLSRKPSIVEQNGAQFQAQGAICNTVNVILAVFRCSEKSNMAATAETSIAILSMY